MRCCCDPRGGDGDAKDVAVFLSIKSSLGFVLVCICSSIGGDAGGNNEGICDANPRPLDNNVVMASDDDDDGEEGDDDADDDDDEPPSCCRGGEVYKNAPPTAR